MFDHDSDYALNKLDKGAIVCRSATGVHTRLTCDDFASDAEFQKWKQMSDEDYHQIEIAGRSDDKCFSVKVFDSTGLSAEDALILEGQKAIDSEAHNSLLQKIKARLTKAHFRRVIMFYAENMTMTEIAAQESVSVQAVSDSLKAAKKKIVKCL